MNLTLLSIGQIEIENNTNLMGKSALNFLNVKQICTGTEHTYHANCVRYVIRQKSIQKENGIVRTILSSMLNLRKSKVLMIRPMLK